MNLLFVDCMDWDYDVSTPLHRPLGGSESALCYLAVELARRGHRVVLANGASEDREVMGVSCLPLDRVTHSLLAQPWDALVVLNGPADQALRVRPQLPRGVPLVLWTQHTHNQPQMVPMHEAEARDAWDVVVFVSDWQRTMFIREFEIQPSRTCVLRNAIAPAFEGMFGSQEELVQSKPPDPVLAYTSSPYRGLQVLLDVFPALRTECPQAELHVYSSMRVYFQDEHQDEFKPLYDQCRSTRGVRYMGSVDQSQLARALRGVSILSYPSVFLETSCIAVSVNATCTWRQRATQWEEAIPAWKQSRQ